MRGSPYIYTSVPLLVCSEHIFRIMYIIKSQTSRETLVTRHAFIAERTNHDIAMTVVDGSLEHTFYMFEHTMVLTCILC